MRTKLSLSLLIFLLFGCSKDKICRDESFCVQVNSKLWWPSSGGDFKAQPLTIHLIDSNNQFWIGAYSGSSSLLVGVIDKVNGIKVGNYVLGGQACCLGTYAVDSASEYRTDSTYSGLLSITRIDRINKTIAGTFYFKAHNAVTGEIVDVSNGMFNARYVEY